MQDPQVETNGVNIIITSIYMPPHVSVVTKILLNTNTKNAKESRGSTAIYLNE